MPKFFKFVFISQHFRFSQFKIIFFCLEWSGGSSGLELSIIWAPPPDPAVAADVAVIVVEVVPAVDCSGSIWMTTFLDGGVSNSPGIEMTFFFVNELNT